MNTTDRGIKQHIKHIKKKSHDFRSNRKCTDTTDRNLKIKEI